MTRFNELLEKRRTLQANIYEEEELILLSKDIPTEELDKIDPRLLTYSNESRLDNLIGRLDEMLRFVNALDKDEKVRPLLKIKTNDECKKLSETTK